MKTPDLANDLLKLRPMPQMAALLRSRLDRIVEQWTAAVERLLPDADPLTTRQVRDSIPKVMEKIAQALESDRPEATTVLEETGVAHGVARFHEHYNIKEVLIEYRLLRRIIFDELGAASGREGESGVSVGGSAEAGRCAFTLAEIIAIDMGIDTALQQGVSEFVRYLTEQLKSTAEGQARYLAYVSHDLRNNLHGITLGLEWIAGRLATSGEFREEAQDVVRLQESVAKTMEGMDRLLQYERLRKGAVELKFAPVDVHRLAGELLDVFARGAQEKGIRLKNEVPPGTSAHSDRELLNLVLQNLIGNAIKYSAGGTVRVEANDDPAGWRIAVSDEGPGIAPHRVSALFEAFTRGQTHGQPGVGLGLNIAASAARLLGSDLQVQSTLGRGSVFSFTVPPAKLGEGV